MNHSTWASTKNKLDSVGCGMCAAKWNQVTIHLQNGTTHSCHHPLVHKIPLSELKNNPTALHNTFFKKQKRKEMLEGKRPSECNFCWNIEDTSNQYSDRVYKSSEPWAVPYIESISQLPWDADVNPTYVEVAWSNACNFKCSYCSPTYSTPWLEEIKDYGPYPTSDSFNDISSLEDQGMMPLPVQEFNPYREAFWKWWPDLYKDLHVFRMTGGEPLLANDTWEVLSYIADTPNPNRQLSLSINTNLGVSDRLVDKLLHLINRIEDESRVKELILYTSVDTWGEQAEYIRHGLEFNRFWDNVNKVLEKCPRIQLSFMVTYNALSVPRFHKLIENVYDLKKRFYSTDRWWPPGVSIDTPYLRWPGHQSIQILPKRPWLERIREDVALMDFYAEKQHVIRPSNIDEILCESPGFWPHEIQKMMRNYDWMKKGIRDKKDLNELRRNFYKFFKEHDRRRGTDFCTAFPELENFFRQCGEL